MAIAKLHMICGNCGSDDDFEFKIDHKGHDVTIDEPKFEPAVFIYCGSCSTIHDLSHNAVMEE